MSSSTALRRRLIDLPGGQVAGVELGPPNRALDVIFLHANGFNAMTYRHALAPLGDAMRVLAVDLRGHGRTTLPPVPDGQGWRVFALDLLSLVGALGERPRVVAGHSMGGTAALLAAREPPFEESRLVLFDPVVAPADAYAAAMDWDQTLAVAALRRKDFFASHAAALAAYRGRGAFRTWPDAVIEDYLQDGLRPRPEGGFALACPPSWEAANFAGFRMADPLAALAARADTIRVLRAESGSTCFVNKDAARYGLETVAGTTHFLPIERPDMVQAALRHAVFAQG